MYLSRAIIGRLVFPILIGLVCGDKCQWRRAYIGDQRKCLPCFRHNYRRKGIQGSKTDHDRFNDELRILPCSFLAIQALVV